MDIGTQVALLLGLVVLSGAFTFGMWPVFTHQFRRPTVRRKRVFKRIYPYAPLDLDLSRVRVTDM